MIDCQRNRTGSPPGRVAGAAREDGMPGKDSPTRGRRFENAICAQFARISKALASPRRVEAVDLLRKKGFEAVRLADGVLEWTASGLALEATGTE